MSLAAMRQDKKVERGRLTFILARGIGQSFVARDVDEASVSAFLTREMAVSDVKVGLSLHYSRMRPC